MKILAVADEESEILWSSHIKERTAGVELIISCGDIRNEYLDFLMTMVNVPMLYVFGNHDDVAPMGGICIEDKIFRFSGFNIMGLGGSKRYKQGKHMYTESEMRRRIFRLKLSAMFRGVDILVTHAPAKGYGDLSDLPHSGFESFNNLMKKYKPAYMLHGHIHSCYGQIKKEYQHFSGTKIFNVSGYRVINIKH